MGFKFIPQNYSKKNQKIEPKQTCYYMAFHLKLNFQCLKRPLLAPYLEPHLGIRFAQEATRWAQESHQELQRPKNSLFKTIKKHLVFTRFWVQRPPKRASRGPRRLPRGTQGAPKPQKKGIQKWTPNLTIFGPILGPFRGPFWAPKLLQNRPKNEILFWSPRESLLGPNQDSHKMYHIQGLGSFLLFLAPLNDH